jgi:MFS transporter, DHA1 family, multidrug resistance protein
MPAAHPAARVQVPAWTAALALALLMGLQPVTTDLYLPALPAIGQHFSASMADLQMTLAATILALGLGQLVWGPVADRWGRRPVLLTGLTVYLAASVAAALAPGINSLLLMRALQGLSMAAAVVCGRAMVRDLYEPQEGAQVMARGLTGLGLMAVSCPLLGGLLTAQLGWRAALAAVAVIGALALLFIARYLPETQAQRNLAALRAGPLLSACVRMPRNRIFLGYAALSACSYCGVVLYLVSSSFLFTQWLGLSPGQYGLALSSMSLAYIGGTLVCRWYLPRLGIVGTARRGALLCMAGGLAMAALALAGVHTAWALLLPQAVYAMGHGINQPCGQTGAVAPFPAEAGTAAALAGFVLALMGFGVTRWLGHATDGTIYPVALGIAFFGVLTAVVAWFVLPAPTMHNTLS